ncbi:MAG TPA: hypothetical protein VG518_09935 [Solirubrobacterales bacterium]|nr:hypothetical protein [Solirubrobacterales bacterium]
MLQKARPKLTYANVVSTLCLFLVLGGAAYAAHHASLVGKDGALHGCVAKGDGALSLVKPHTRCPQGTASLRFGQRGRTGQPGPVGATGPAGRSALTSLGQGETETGAWGSSGAATNSTALFSSAVTFPIPLAGALDAKHTVLVSGASATHCPGTGQAQPGYLCVYVTVARGIYLPASVVNKPTAEYEADEGASKSGFVVIGYTSDTTVEFWGTWAVTG